MLTKELLKAIVKYDPITGKLTTRHPYHKKELNRPCSGYLSKLILGKKYLVHQLAFMYMEGYIPKLIDHIDGNIQNNSWENLRNATKSLNGLNTDKSTGCYKRNNKWYAHCMVKGKLKHLGTFSSFEEAKEYYEDYKRKYR